MTINGIVVFDHPISFELILAGLLFIVLTTCMIIYDIKKEYKWDDLGEDINIDYKVDNV